MHAIEINYLIKEYRNGVKALNGLSLTVKKGEIFSLLGPNGAGKSTLLNILTTYFPPTSGTVTILGNDLVKMPAMIRRQIACVAQNVTIDEHLSLKENMIFQSRLYKVDKDTAKKRIETLINSFGLSQYVNYPVATYSGGVKRRLDIAMNMVSNPKILFLDEPTAGMDASSRKTLWEMIRTIQKEFGTTIFLTTHYLEEADLLSDTICIMKKGRQVAQDSPEKLKRYTRRQLLSIRFSDIQSLKVCAEDLKTAHLLSDYTVCDNSIVSQISEDRTIFIEVNKWLLDHSVSFDAVEVTTPSLEDVFLYLTGKEEI